MNFLTGLAGRISQGVNQRIQDKRAERLSDQQFQKQLQQRSELLPYELQESEAKFQHKLDMEKKYLPQMQEIEREKKAFEKQIQDDLKKLPAVSDPDYLAAMQGNDFSTMYQIAAQKPELMPHLEQYYTMIGKHKQAYDQHLKKVEEIEKIKTKYAGQRAGFRGARGGRSGSAGTTGSTPDPVSGIADSKERRKTVMRSIAKTKEAMDGLTYALQTETDPAKRAEYASMLDQYNLKMQEFRNDLSLLDGSSAKFEVSMPGREPTAGKSSPDAAKVRPEVKKAIANAKSDKDIEAINAMKLTQEEADWANSEMAQKQLQSMLDNFEKRSQEYLSVAFPKRNVVKRTEAK